MDLTQLQLLLFVGAPFGVAAVTPWVWRLPPRPRSALLAAVPAASFAWLLSAGVGYTAAVPWVPALGIELSFGLDGLARLFATLIAGIGAVVAAFSSPYFGRDRRGAFFVSALFAFMGSMLGAVTATNVLTLFVFWELTSITSYLLIGFDHEDASVRDRALQALLVTTAGGVAMLAGLVLWGTAAGGYDFASLASFDLRGHAWYLPVFALLLAGAATKSAQVPFHFWLPNAMAAPTPASAYLHSATMVKLGVYALARFAPSLGGTEAWAVGLGTVGGVTLVAGALLAFGTTDAKRMLAYTTVGALGLMVLLLAWSSESGAAKAAMGFLVAHALYKAPLFLAVGAIEHETGTRDLRALGGLRRLMPGTFAVVVTAALSMAGLPPTFAFLAKEAALGTVAATNLGAALTFLALGVGGAGFAGVAALFVVRPWFGPKPERLHAHEAPPLMWSGPLVLALTGIAAGLWRGEVGSRFVAPAVEAVSGEPTSVTFAYWHGFDAPLVATLVGLGAGASSLWLQSALAEAVGVLLGATAWLHPERGYGWTMGAIRRSAQATARGLQHGRLRWYVATSLLAAILLASVPTLRSGWIAALPATSEWHAYELAVAALIVLGAVAAAATSDRLFAIAGLGAVGLGTALIYVLFSAPDLALTQLLVDTLTVVLLVLAYYHFPRALPRASWPTQLRDAALAAMVGAFVALLLLAALAAPAGTRVSEEYVARSLPEAFGRNVVNVILVDFRALDTLGEIAVLAVAGIGVYALLKLRRAGEERERT